MNTTNMDIVTEYKRLKKFIQGKPVSLSVQEFELLNSYVKRERELLDSKEVELALREFLYKRFLKEPESSVQDSLSACLKDLSVSSILSDEQRRGLERGLRVSIQRNKLFFIYPTKVEVKLAGETVFVCIFMSTIANCNHSPNPLSESFKVNSRDIMILFYPPAQTSLDITKCHNMIEFIEEEITEYFS